MQLANDQLRTLFQMLHNECSQREGNHAHAVALGEEPSEVAKLDLATSHRLRDIQTTVASAYRAQGGDPEELHDKWEW